MSNRLPKRLMASHHAMVLSRSRRWVFLLNERGEELRGMATEATDDVTVGDFVLLKQDEESTVVAEILPRTSFLSRSYGRATRRIAANVDHLYVVTAPPPLFNTAFLDRILTAAYLQNIPCTIVLNKIDLECEETAPLVELYDGLDVKLLSVSAKTGAGIELFHQTLNDPALSIIVLAGVSGVGKSTLLNALVPDAARRTGSVSDRTGQGRQTTSQSYACRYERASQPDLFIIDLPGIQNFGITDLESREVEQSFSDFAAFRANCEYGDCYHDAEPVCGVKDAVQEGQLPLSRYESYLQMLEEIERMREY